MPVANAIQLNEYIRLSFSWKNGDDCFSGKSGGDCAESFWNYGDLPKLSDV
jgi:hypothetical protein